MKPSVCLLLLFCFLFTPKQRVGADELSPDEQLPGPLLIGLQGDVPSLKGVQVKSDHVYDYTFSKAPSDWRVQSGKWNMTNRWTCAPGWSWFGGHSEEVASIWNKRKFSGDFSLHVYFAFKEGLERETPNWRERHSDVGLSFCGDGNNLGSGYALVFGADNNRHSVLLKQGQKIAESLAPEALFPSMTDGLPPSWERVVDKQGVKGSTVLRQAYGQTRWWHANINKIGNRVECWLDNKLLFAYDDPQPLNEGQIALWTYNNGVVLSRVQIYYENEVKRSFVKKSQAGEPKGPQTVSEVVKSEVKERIAAPE